MGLGATKVHAGWTSGLPHTLSKSPIVMKLLISSRGISENVETLVLLAELELNLVIHVRTRQQGPLRDVFDYPGVDSALAPCKTTQELPSFVNLQPSCCHLKKAVRLWVQVFHQSLHVSNLSWVLGAAINCSLATTQASLVVLCGNTCTGSQFDKPGASLVHFEYQVAILHELLVLASSQGEVVHNGRPH